MDFSAGCDSGRVTTIESSANPRGLKRNQLAWLGNGTVRGGGIIQRTGFQPLIQKQKWSGLYQGGWMYEQLNGDPYLVLDIGGKTWQCRVDTDNSVHNITFGAGWPANITQHWWTQGEQFGIRQNGVNEPQVWDGVILRNISSMGGPPPFLPTGTAMQYFMGRVWVASGGRQYMGGDIVRGPNGTAPYLLTDSILHSVENTYLSGGGAFTLPTNAGNIRALAKTSALDSSTGEGQLYISSRKTIYRLNVPVDRAAWVLAVEPKLPLQTVAQINYGGVSDRSFVEHNGDLFYQTMEPGVRSLVLAVRYFNLWGNTGISKNETRCLNFVDRSLLRFSTGIELDNRLLQSTLPIQTPVGVAHQGIMPLDFDIISSLEDKSQNNIQPAWEGMLEGLDVLQLFQGDFGGRQRGFAVVYSRVSLQIEVWELTDSSRTDNGDNRVSWYFETPSLDWKNVFKLKELETVELWFDSFSGTVEFEAYTRPDQHACWYFLHAWKHCSARNCKEDATNLLPCVYPTQEFCQTEMPSFTLPKPSGVCNRVTGRPISWGYQHQLKIVVKGYCRFRGYLMHALEKDKAPWQNIVC
jgi:hypothetical protein